MELTLLTKELPQELASQIDNAVHNFIQDSHMTKTAEFEGARQQTVEHIAHSIYKGGDGYNGDFWISKDGERLVSYALCTLNKDIDNSLTYWILQAYISPKYRNLEYTAQWYKTLENRAKDLGAKHLVAVSSREEKAYFKLLGKDWHHYAYLIKKDL